MHIYIYYRDVLFCSLSLSLPDDCKGANSTPSVRRVTWIPIVARPFGEVFRSYLSTLSDCRLYTCYERAVSVPFLNAQPTGGRVVYLLFRYVSILFICKSAATLRLPTTSISYPALPPPPPLPPPSSAARRLLTQSYYLVSQPVLYAFS